MMKSSGFLNAHKLGRTIIKENRFTGGGLCAFGVTSNIPNDVDYQLRAPCHAALDRMRLEGEYAYMVDAVYPHETCITEAQAKRYARYVLKDSPYSPMFAEKNIEKGWKRKYFLYNVDVDSNLLVGGAVLLRMLSEVPKIPEVWNALVEAGADPDMAILLSHMCGISPDGMFYINNHSTASHRALVPTWFKKENVNNFIRGKHKLYGIYKDKEGYCGFNGMWGEYRDISSTPISFGCIIYKRWMEVIKDFNSNKDIRIPLFYHHGKRDIYIENSKLNYKVAMPIIAKILNDYRGELNG